MSASVRKVGPINMGQMSGCPGYSDGRRTAPDLEYIKGDKDKGDPTNKTWTWGARHCDNAFFDTDCPDGFKIVGGSRKLGGTGCGYWPGRYGGWQVRCFKDVYPKDPITLMNCCRGKKGMIDVLCHPEYCKASKTNCKNVYVDYCSSKDASGVPMITTPIGYDLCRSQLKNGDDDDKSMYNEIMVDVCTSDKNPENLLSLACQEYCNETKNCTKALTTFCADKYSQPGKLNTEYQSTCGCFYPQNIYDDFYTKLSNDVNLPVGLLDAKPFCYFPACGNANVLPINSNDIKCRNPNVTKCIQNNTVTAGGTITGNITINPICKISTNPEYIPGLTEKQAPIGSGTTGSGSTGGSGTGTIGGSTTGGVSGTPGSGTADTVGAVGAVGASNIIAGVPNTTVYIGGGVAIAVIFIVIIILSKK